LGLRGDPGTQRPSRASAHRVRARPARRFDALQVSTGRRSRTGFPDGGPSFASAPLQRSIAAPPHRPVGRTDSSDDASSPGLSLPTTRTGTADPRDGRESRSRPRAACEVSDLLRGVHHRPSRRPKAPERPWDSPSKAFPSHAVGAPLGVPALVPLRAVRHSREGGRKAPASGRRSRCESVRRAVPCGRASRCLPGVCPSRAFPLSVPADRFGSRGLPLHAPRCDVHRPRASWGLEDRRGRLVPLGTAGPPGVCRLATVAAPREARDGERAHGFASRLARVAGGANRSLLPRGRADRGVTPGPAPPSFGGRLASSSVRQCLFFKERERKSNLRAERANPARGERHRIFFAAYPRRRNDLRARRARDETVLHIATARTAGTREPMRAGESGGQAPAGRARDGSCVGSTARGPHGNRDSRVGGGRVHEVSTPRLERRPAARSRRRPSTRSARAGLAPLASRASLARQDCARNSSLRRLCECILL
jgi:hypothetical protein